MSSYLEKQAQAAINWLVTTRRLPGQSVDPDAMEKAAAITACLNDVKDRLDRVEIERMHFVRRCEEAQAEVTKAQDASFLKNDALLAVLEENKVLRAKLDAVDLAGAYECGWDDARNKAPADFEQGRDEFLRERGSK